MQTVHNPENSFHAANGYLISGISSNLTQICIGNEQDTQHFLKEEEATLATVPSPHFRVPERKYTAGVVL